MKSLISVSLITLLCFALCYSQFTAPDCHGNTTQGGYNPCRKRCDNLRNPPRFCPLFLLQGCTCKNGYIPVDSSYKPLKCVKEEDCPK
ncbi:TIL domain-containing protein [Caerostris darwini]|uniref:TIL domain-containing protein n=1 Tax=Caerostris darwini TaxID=1538125 RepID=A0AAV4PSY5_9ARAC|nr:TIL domain-containing protein [Caerostris darwini]